MDNQSGKSNFEKEIVEKLAFAAITEQRRNRRWKIFFLFLFFIYLFTLPILMSGKFEFPDLKKGVKHTALVDLDGVISSDDRLRCMRSLRNSSTSFSVKCRWLPRNSRI